MSHGWNTERVEERKDLQNTIRLRSLHFYKSGKVLLAVAIFIATLRIGYIWGQQSGQSVQPKQSAAGTPSIIPTDTPYYHPLVRILPTVMPSLYCLGNSCPGTGSNVSPSPIQTLQSAPEGAESAGVQGTLQQVTPDDNLKQNILSYFNWDAAQLPVTWYSAGKFTDGPLKGYTRYILVTDNMDTDHWDQGCGHTDIATDGSTVYRLPSLWLNTTLKDGGQYIFTYLSLATTWSAGNACVLQTDLTGFQPIASPFSQYKAYNFPTNADPYISTNNQVLLVDSAGLPMVYFYDSAQHIKAANTPGSTLNLFDINTLSGVYPNYQIGLFTSFGEGGDTQSLIDSFDQTVYKRFTDQNLHQIGMADGLPVFAPVDTNDAALQQVYSNAVNGCTDTPIPDFLSYVKKPPLLVTKDPWNRYLVFEETMFHQGCGGAKPVIYLYPPQPEEVHVSFVKSMDLTVQIPTYTNGWDVLAHPDGSLTDLLPQFTDCQHLDQHRFGSEYAVAACLQNSYPYLYWEGNARNTSFPMLKSGWIVERQSLASFFNEKLSYIGLTSSEIRDMTSYWVPLLLQQKAPYFHLAFLQNDTLDQLVPVHVIPQPDSMIRVFLDWQALAAKPNTAISAEKLIPMSRKGFSYVEWGGMMSQ